jgi:hypothetical protein
VAASFEGVGSPVGLSAGAGPDVGAAGRPAWSEASSAAPEPDPVWDGPLHPVRNVTRAASVAAPARADRFIPIPPV